MSEHRIKLNWRRTSEAFDYKSYNRAHTLTFKNGLSLEASAAPAYRGDPDMVDPEEAFVASAASCHMLTFLAIASRRGLTVDSYMDDPVGHLERNEEGRLAITRIIMRPQVVFSGGAIPHQAKLREMHEQSHHDCFIASSIKTHIDVELAAPAGTP